VPQQVNRVRDEVLVYLACGLWIGHLKLGRQRAGVQAIQFWIYVVEAPAEVLAQDLQTRS
jgi:hypothetical protein